MRFWDDFSLIWAKKNEQAKEAIDKLISDFNDTEIPYEELEWLAERYEAVGEINTAHNMFEQIVQECSPCEDFFVLAKAHLDKYALFDVIESGDKNKVQEMVQQMGSELSNADSERNLLVCRENKVDLYLRTMSQACYNRGWALKTSGNVSKAKEYFLVDVAIMERLFTDFPNSSLAPSGAFCAAVVSGQELDDYGKAADYFQRVADSWPDYKHADLCQLKAAEYLTEMVKYDLLPAEQTKPVIIEAYQAVIDNYPQSKYAQSAAVRLKNLNNNKR